MSEYTSKPFAAGPKVGPRTCARLADHRHSLLLDWVDRLTYTLPTAFCCCHLKVGPSDWSSATGWSITAISPIPSAPTHRSLPVCSCQPVYGLLHYPLTLKSRSSHSGLRWGLCRGGGRLLAVCQGPLGAWFVWRLFKQCVKHCVELVLTSWFTRELMSWLV